MAGEENTQTLSELLPEDLQENQKLAEFGDNVSEAVPKLAKSFVDTQSKLGSMQEEHKKALEGTVKIPDEEADDDTRREFFTKLGCPNKAENYPDIQIDGLPEGFEQNDETTKAIRDACHKAGVPSNQYQAVMGEITKQQLVSLDNFVKQDKAAEEEAVKTLTNKWGGEEKFNKRVELGKRLIEKYDGPESKVKDFLVDSRLGSYAPLVSLLGDIAADVMPEETTVTGGTAGGKKGSEVEISPTTGEPVLNYDKSPELNK